MATGCRRRAAAAAAAVVDDAQMLGVARRDCQRLATLVISMTAEPLPLSAVLQHVESLGVFSQLYVRRSLRRVAGAPPA